MDGQTDKQIIFRKRPLPPVLGGSWGGGAAVTGRGVAGEMLNNDFIRTAVVMTGAAGL